MRAKHCRIITGMDKDVPDPAGWLITFNDLITLLLVFFVLLFATGRVRSQQSGMLVDSLQGALGVLLEGKKTGVQVERPIQRPEPSDRSVSDDDSGTGFRSSESSPDTVMDDLADDPEIQVIQTPRGYSITLSDGILFASGVAELRPEACPVLNKIIDAVRANHFAIRVEGHTDNVPIQSGRFPSNWDLSVARAVHVVKYFTEIGKIAPQRFSAVGYGASKPLYSNDSPVNREKNRRVEIILEMMNT